MRVEEYENKRGKYIRGIREGGKYKTAGARLIMLLESKREYRRVYIREYIIIEYIKGYIIEYVRVV